MPVDRTHRAVLQQLGQLYRHDLSEAMALLPNPDGTFNNRRLDRFLAEVDKDVKAWLITAAGRLAGFVMTTSVSGGGTSIHDFFVVRAMRRSGVGREAARQVIAMFPGRWRIGFQPYNPGVQRFWTQVADAFVGDHWEYEDEPPVPGRPSDRWIVFTT